MEPIVVTVAVVIIETVVVAARTSAALTPAQVYVEVTGVFAVHAQYISRFGGEPAVVAPKPKG